MLKAPVLLFSVSSISLALSLLFFSFFVSFSNYSANAVSYYAQQSNHDEDTVPLAGYRWENDRLDVCIYKEKNIPNSFYVWTKLAVQNWRQALRDYTNKDIHDKSTWQITARYTPSADDFPKDCNVQIYIYDSYKEFPDYPAQTGAYTAVEYNENGIALKASVYLAPIVRHGTEDADIDLPPYAFRNSAVHEMGHVFGLAHMKSNTGYLMSPTFDFWKEKDQMPITTLELSAITKLYGNSGWSSSSAG